jgi:protein involved in polysaccharide export with SLBB domain
MVHWVRWSLIGLLAAALPVGPLGPSPARAQPAEISAYRLGTGDRLRITVFNEPTLSGEVDVNDQGVISLGLIGPVAVGGKTIPEVEALVTQRYGKDYLVNPRVNVEVLNYRPFFILGEVTKPGSYPFQNGMTVVNAVALAGGYTPRANKDRVYVKRASNPKAGEQRVEEDAVILPGDVVRVAERFF